MHARMVVCQLQPGKTDEWFAICRDSIVPAAKQQKGFKGFVVFRNSTDKAILYSLWETEADLLANETSNFYQAQIDKFKGVLAEAPHREVYEIDVLA